MADIENKKEREVNFSQADCLLLSRIMGQPSGLQDLNNHQLMKHRFNSGITSSTKKSMWRHVAEEFNQETAYSRTADKLEKKWLNMVAKHRLLYADYQKDLRLTGGGSSTKVICPLTEAVMDVIGRETAAIAGAASTSLDTSFIQLETSTISEAVPLLELQFPVADDTTVGQCTCMSNCHTSLQSWTLEDLKKRKLILQIQYLEKKLKE